MAEKEKNPEEYVANAKISGGIDGKTILPEEPAKTENEVFNEKSPASSTKMKNLAPIMILVGLLLLAIAGASYYFLVYKPKTNQVPAMVEDVPTIENMPVEEEAPAEASSSATEADPQLKNLDNINQTDNLNQMETDLNDLDFSGFDTEMQDLKF